ncbi:MAG TPA: serine hydrolase domain-containing protein [Thermomicrobiales bacterium]|nr:serine hydrolase domain-containing protein [Thermomicrobiales bacterium]
MPDRAGGPGAPNRDQVRPADPARLLAAAREHVVQGDVPGAAVAVWRDGQPVIEAGVGAADLAGTIPLDAGARFPVYSVTKTFIAAAVLRLVERGAVALDEPIGTYLPDLPLPTAPTVRQLLRHTGGMADYGGLAAYHDAVRQCPERPWSDDEFLRRTLAARLAWQPGERFAYSNVGYMLLRLLLERQTAGSLGTALSNEMFARLGLRETRVLAALEDMRGLTPGYSTQLGTGDAPADVVLAYHPGWVSHGLVASTAPELARAMDGLFAGRLFGGDLLAAMVEPVLVPDTHPLFIQPAYGLGLMIDAGVEGLFAGHGGDGPGYSIGAAHLAMASTRVTSVALVNRDEGMLGLRVAAALARLAAGEEPAAPRPPDVRT